MNNAKNKKEILLLLAFLMFTLFACSNNRGAGKNSVSAVLESGMSAEAESVEIDNIGNAAVVKNPYTTIDVDLTAMPQKLAYTTANRMNLVSEDYIGQTVKMSGTCSVFHDEKRDLYFYTCEIYDETACCTFGIEFELLPDYKFPDDFPKEKDDVTVVGVFDTYKEGARTYKTLRKAVLL